MNNNDSKILELKQQIQDKKDKLSKVSRFNPLTNCILNINNESYNLNTINKIDTIDLLLVNLNIIRLSAIDLKMADFKVSGYTVEDWMDDLISKKNIINSKSEQQQLIKMEEKLDKMLSNEKKTELELEDIANLLKTQ